MYICLDMCVHVNSSAGGAYKVYGYPPLKTAWGGCVLLGVSIYDG